MDATTPENTGAQPSVPPEADGEGVSERLTTGRKPQRDKGDSIDIGRPRRNKKWVRVLLYSCLGLFSFLLFFYYTFPFGIVREILVTQINDTLIQAQFPARFAVERLEPSWVTGVKITNATLTSVVDPKVKTKLTSVTVRIGVLPLLIGKINLKTVIEQQGGSLQVVVDLPIWRLLIGAGIPDYVDVKFNSFGLDQYYAQLLPYAKGSRNMVMMTLAPTLVTTTLGGKLQGSILVEINDSQMKDVKGKVDISFKDLYIADSTGLIIPRQDFETARIQAGFEGNALVISDATKLAAKEISLATNGKITLPKGPQDALQLDLRLEVGLSGQVLKNLDILLPLVSTSLGCSQGFSNGQLKARLSMTGGRFLCQ